MLKPLTFEGRFESGFDELTKNRVCAVVAVCSQEQPGTVGLGLAIANEAGYHAVPLTWVHSDSWDEMEKHAEQLNAELFGLTPGKAARIVASTMFRPWPRKAGAPC